MDKKQTQHSPESLAAELESHAERLTLLSGVIAATAIYDTLTRDRLQEASGRVIAGAAELSRVAGELTIEDRFGDEASYWTVYRMFAAGDNVGRLWTADEIWEYLSKNYRLAGESRRSVDATLLEWGADIETDAAERGIIGNFGALDGGYIFAETAASAAARRTASAKKPVRRRPAVRRAAETLPAAVEPLANEKGIEEIEIVTPEQAFERSITGLLADSPGSIVKQAAIKKELGRLDDVATPEQLQHRINDLVNAGTLYKFRRNKVAYLSLDEHSDDEESIDDESGESRERTHPIDVSLSLDILRTLTAPGTHFNQKLTLVELWRRISDIGSKSQSIPNSVLENLKRVCRDLQEAGLIVAGGEKMGSSGPSAGGYKRRRSASRQVFKVGLGSQEQKREIQALLEYSDVEGLLRQRLDSSLTDN